MKLKFFSIVLALFVYFFSQNAIGQDFFVKKKYRDWNVYASASNKCFLASRAKRTSSYFNSQEVLGKKRQNSFVYLSLNNIRIINVLVFEDVSTMITCQRCGWSDAGQLLPLQTQ